jgi:DNA replication and repair protein RecF
MHLTRLTLTNFRSYKKFAADFRGAVLFVGPNGTGKTNLLEAIFLLAVFKSYRAVSDAETIRFGEEFTKITGSIAQGASPIAGSEGTKERAEHHLPGATDELELIIHKMQKRGKRNGAAKPLSQLIGTLKAVLFSPEQLTIVTGPPRHRRRFLDSMLAQIDARYTQALLEYQKALGQRNALLSRIKEGGASSTELYFWDKRLIEAGAIITQRRHKLAAFLNETIAPQYDALAQGGGALVLVPRFQELSHELLKEHLARDIQLAVTTVGPHRDNFVLELGGRELGIFGSRGEWRAALFAVKAAELAFLEHEGSEEPILLLDDVFSELDASRRDRLLAFFARSQTFLTATGEDVLPKEILPKLQAIEVARYASPVK